MIHGVGGSGAAGHLGALQQLQARRAFRPPVEDQRPDPAEFLPEAPAEPASTVDPVAARLNLPVADIQAVAQRAGFVGVTERAIQRAYTLGESLLVDTHA